MILNTELEHKGNLLPSKIASYKKDGNKLYFTSENKVILELTIERDSVLRFRYSTTGIFDKDFSYAITKYASKGFNHLEIEENKEVYVITTSKLICHISKLDLRKSIFDKKTEALICEDELGFHWEESYELGGDIVKMSLASQESESYYGLGDKPVENNLKGKRFKNWVTDSYAYTRNTDPIYKTIPFYTAIHHQKSYGIFFDNTFPTFFDFCNEKKKCNKFLGRRR